jgi:hypothetical protein
LSITLKSGRGHDVRRFAQLRNHAGHFGAAAGLAQHVDAGMGRFERFFDLGQRHRQAAGVKDDHLFRGSCGND